MFDNLRRALRWAFRRAGRTLKPPKLPDSTWIEKAGNYALYTPDLVKLEEHKKVLLFVYNTIQRGHDNYGVIEDETEFRGECFTKGSYHMFRWDNGKDEIEALVLKEQDRPRMGRLREPLLSSVPRSIKGELFLAEPKLLITLDNVMENGYVFRRERVKVVLPFDIHHGSYQTSERQYAHIWAYWYVGHPDWYKALEGDPESFKPVGMYEPRDPMLSPYYSFTMRDYGD